MVDNPFYIGYTPSKEEGAGSLYPGYYPGKPLPKKRRPYRAKIQPVPQFGIDQQMNAFLDSFAADIEAGTLGVPGWIKDRMAEEFKEAMRITNKPPKEVPYDQLDEYDTASMPGGGFLQLNLDPRDWIKDPKKELRNIGQKWFLDALNWHDFETLARAEFFERATMDIPFAGAATPEEMALYNAYTDGGRNPLSLRGLGATNPHVFKKTPAASFRDSFLENSASPKNDLFAEAAQRLKAFAKAPESPLTRETAFDEFLRASLAATKSDLAGALSDAAHPAHAAAVANAAMIQNFNATVDIAHDIEDLSDNLGKLNSSLDEVILASGLRSTSAATSAADRTKNIRALISDGSHGMPKSRLVQRLEDAMANPGIYDGATARVLDEYKAALDHLRATLADADNTSAVTSLASGAGALQRRSSASVLQRTINTSPGLQETIMGRRLTGGDIFTPSLERRLLRGLSADMRDSTGGIGAFLLANDMDAARLAMWMDHMETFRLGEDVSNFLSKLDQGISPAAKVFLWQNRLTRGLSASRNIYLPKDAVFAFLERTHNFGLVIDNEKLEKSGFYHSGFNYMNKPNQLFGNYFNLNIQVGTETRRVNFYGGKQFGSIRTLNTAMRAGLLGDAELRALLIDGQQLLVGGTLNPIFASLGFTAADLANPDVIAKLTELQEQVDLLRNYMAAHIADFGPGANLNDLELWKSVIKQLATSRHQITDRYMGLMTKLGNAINMVQQKIYALPIFGKIVRKVTYYKDAIKVAVQKAVKEAVKKVTAKLIATATRLGLRGLAQVIGSAAPGIGNLLAWIAADLIEKILNKILGAIKNAFQTLRDLANGNIDKILDKKMEAQNKQAMRIMKFIFFLVVVWVVLGWVLNLVMPSPNSLGTMADPYDDGMVFALSMFSPVDMTRKWGTIAQDFSWNITYGSTGGAAGGGADNPGVGTTPITIPGDPGSDGPYTPPPVWTGPLPAPGGGDSIVNCFRFVNGNGTPTFANWSDAGIAVMTTAIEALQTGTGSYLSKLCAGGDINVYAMEDSSTGGYCGMFLGGRTFRMNVYKPNCHILAGGLNQHFVNFVFAHETGHLYESIYGRPGFEVPMAAEGVMPLYPWKSYNQFTSCDDLHSWTNGMASEDFAETIGNYINLNCFTAPAYACSPCSTFGSKEGLWAHYPQHYIYAISNLFN